MDGRLLQSFGNPRYPAHERFREEVGKKSGNDCQDVLTESGVATPDCTTGGKGSARSEVKILKGWSPFERLGYPFGTQMIRPCGQDVEPWKLVPKAIRGLERNGEGSKQLGIAESRLEGVEHVHNVKQERGTRKQSRGLGAPKKGNRFVKSIRGIRQGKRILRSAKTWGEKEAEKRDLKRVPWMVKMESKIHCKN